MNPFIAQIKQLYLNGSMTVRLVMVNVGVFVIIQVFNALDRLQILSSGTELLDNNWSHVLFALPVEPIGIALKPWTLLSSLFAHFSLMHLFSNLLFLFFAGNTYERFYGAKRLIHLYIIGGLAGNLTEIIAHLIFPALQASSFSIVGASGAIMAIFSALAFAQPQLQVQLFGVFPLKIIFLALFFFLKDLSSIGSPDQIAHFAHLGGALFGFLSIQQFWHIRMAQPWLGISFKTTKPAFKVKKGGRPMNDDQYRADKQAKQVKLDQILDKISKKGYDSLSKDEKDFLFQQSKNG
ncbi:MAG: rhomboid family intramembrane serine protease [Flavobacteriales bacterium]